MEIEDKVCSGKITEAQMKSLVRCFDLIKPNSSNQQQFDLDIKACLKHSETDIGFSIEESNKKSIYLICSSKFRSCMLQKLFNLNQSIMNQFDDLNETMVAKSGTRKLSKHRSDHISSGENNQSIHRIFESIRSNPNQTNEILAEESLRLTPFQRDKIDPIIECEKDALEL
ncbi:autophagy-related protein 9A [Sarcoptes scabiei]|nr:autophagy-related protein 9A [Sarcoptes scabiei]